MLRAGVLERRFSPSWLFHGTLWTHLNKQRDHFPLAGFAAAIECPIPVLLMLHPMSPSTRAHAASRALVSTHDGEAEVRHCSSSTANGPPVVQAGGLWWSGPRVMH